LQAKDGGGPSGRGTGCIARCFDEAKYLGVSTSAARRNGRIRREKHSPARRSERTGVCGRCQSGERAAQRLHGWAGASRISVAVGSGRQCGCGAPMRLFRRKASEAEGQRITFELTWR
jgi:hypothetical protein